jgi:hypothetical protein
MATLKEMIQSSLMDLKRHFKDELNDRGIGGEQFQANKVLEGGKKYTKGWSKWSCHV